MTLVLHAVATWFMVGLIWTIQSVHYPLFAKVGERAFPAYEAEHASRMASLLAIPAGIEVVTGAGLIWFRPEDVGLPLVLVSGALLAMIWILTLLMQLPEHRRLQDGKDPLSIARLVRTNWARTGLWTARGVMVAVMLAL